MVRPRSALPPRRSHASQPGRGAQRGEAMTQRMGLIGKKIGMTQIFDEAGQRIPVTVLQLGPNVVIQKKTKDSKDGYNAIQLGFDEKPHRKVNKAMSGHYK